MSNPYNNPNAVAGSGQKTYSKKDQKNGLNVYDQYGADTRDQAEADRKQRLLSQVTTNTPKKTDQPQNNNQSNNQQQKSNGMPDWFNTIGNLAKPVGQGGINVFANAGNAVKDYVVKPVVDSAVSAYKQNVNSGIIDQKLGDTSRVSKDLLNNQNAEIDRALKAGDINKDKASKLRQKIQDAYNKTEGAKAEAKKTTGVDYNQSAGAVDTINTLLMGDLIKAPIEGLLGKVAKNSAKNDAAKAAENLATNPTTPPTSGRISQFAQDKVALNKLKNAPPEPKPIGEDFKINNPDNAEMNPGGEPLKPAEPDGVIQAVNPKTGEQKFIKPTDAEYQAARTKLDEVRSATSLGDAGKVNEDGFVYHITDRTPEDMAKRGFSDGGTFGEGKMPGTEPVAGTALAPEVAATSMKQPETNKFNSRVYDRLKAEHPDTLTDDVSAEAITLKGEAEKAVKLIAEDRQQAFRIATGQETSPQLTSTSANIALFEKAVEEGNTKLANRLATNRSLAQTRRGQELVSEKASISDNSTSRYLKELIGIKMDQLGKKHTFGINLKDSTRKKATLAIDKEVKRVEEKIKSKKLDVKTALSLLDSLECI